MKKKLLTLFLIASTLTLSIAQTTLSAGDIMFIGVNSDPSGSPTADEFAVIFLKPVTAGTEIYFTDFGYTGNAAPYFQQNPNNGCGASTGGVSDGMIKWTAPTGGVTMGYQLVIRVKVTGSLPTSNIGSITIIAESSGVGQGMSLTSAGEAVHAFQGTINGSNQVTSATMLSSIDYDAIWTPTVTTCQFSSTISEDPNTGFEFSYPTHMDNGYYTGPLTGDQATLQTAILNSTNWTMSNTTSGTLPFDNILSTTDFEEIQDIKMYPNPASEMVYFNKNIKKISVYNSLGQKLLETSENYFNIQPYISGIYLIKVETEKGISVKKLMKN